MDEYTIAGTKGSIRVSPGFMFDLSLEFSPLTVGTKKTNEKFKETDQFGGELKYFSDCILKVYSCRIFFAFEFAFVSSFNSSILQNIEPEADGEEGFCDIRVLMAIIRSIETKTVQKLAPYTRARRIEASQEEKLNPVKPPKETNATPPIKE